MAAVGGLSVEENMALGHTRRYARQGGLSMDWKSVRDDLEESLKALGFDFPSFRKPMGALSGGNLQRIILARELAHNPGLILAFYPTRGLDVKSAVAARGLLMSSRNNGSGVLLMSEDLGELFSMSDRIVVLFRGRIVGQGVPGALTLHDVGHLMTGSKEKPAGNG
jgi:simple sugar transport system ATP-binding protein